MTGPRARLTGMTIHRLMSAMASQPVHLRQHRSTTSAEDFRAPDPAYEGAGRDDDRGAAAD